MNIKAYKEFKDDVELYLEEVISQYTLYFNNDLALIRGENPNLYVYLENSNCRIGLNALESFPHESVAFHIFLLDYRKHEVYIEHHFLNKFLGINEKVYNTQILGHYNSLEEFMMHTVRGGYLGAIISVNESIKKFYYPLFDGTYNYTMYEKWLYHITSNYDITDKKICLPSYNDIRNNLTI